MNERITKIVKQSGGEFWQRIENDVVNPEAYITFDPLESLDKFVELIVRECADIANRQFSAATGLDDRDCLTAHQMKQHFGVEE